MSKKTYEQKMYKLIELILKKQGIEHKRENRKGGKNE